jgi:ubiquinone biosynthesis protein COQ4
MSTTLTLDQATGDTRIHVLEAWRAFRRLRKNPEDSTQVFTIFRALRGKSFLKAFNRFATSDAGTALLTRRPSLIATLSNRGALAQLPEGSLGRTYLAFMEAENLSAEGLQQAAQAANWDKAPVTPEMAFYRDRMRDAHDLTHVLTGYGRDPLGEICLLAFMYAHSRNPGNLFLIAMSWLRMPAVARNAVKEAWNHGKQATWFQNLDFEALLGRDLNATRWALNIAAPARYRSLMQ